MASNVQDSKVSETFSHSNKICRESSIQLSGSSSSIPLSFEQYRRYKSSTFVSREDYGEASLCFEKHKKYWDMSPSLLRVTVLDSRQEDSFLEERTASSSNQASRNPTLITNESILFIPSSNLRKIHFQLYHYGNKFRTCVLKMPIVVIFCIRNFFLQNYAKKLSLTGANKNTMTAIIYKTCRAACCFQISRTLRRLVFQASGTNIDLGLEEEFNKLNHSSAFVVCTKKCARPVIRQRSQDSPDV